MPLLPQTENSKPTVEQNQAGAADDIRRLAKLGWRRLLELHSDGLQLVWDNNRGLTPQQVCDGLGTDAANAFAFHRALGEFLVAAAAREGVTLNLPMPKKGFTVNLDGTVTIGKEAYDPAVESASWTARKWGAIKALVTV